MKLLTPLDHEEQLHCRRVAAISKLLAESAGLSLPEVRAVEQSALLHDIGKSAIPQEILHKSESLTKREQLLIQSHTTMGKQILDGTESLLSTAPIVALQHHERLDGSGYLGLRGSAIHPHARLIAVADVFDALHSRRTYKDVWDTDRICAYLKSCAGTQLDAEIVFLFLSNLAQVLHTCHAVCTHSR